MNVYLFIAGCLLFLLGLGHSILGEVLIFKYQRKKGTIIPSKRSGDLKERHIRIIWATWHLASVLGWCLAAFLLKISFLGNYLDNDFSNYILNLITYSMLAGSFLVLIGTRGKHPGWIVFLCIAILVWIA